MKKYSKYTWCIEIISYNTSGKKEVHYHETTNKIVAMRYIITYEPKRGYHTEEYSILKRRVLV